MPIDYSEEEKKRERWERLYGEQENIRRLFKQPYVQAIAPVVAGIIDFHGKPKTRILVVGGGKGRFSRDLLPEVIKHLREKGNNTEVDVVESDLNEVIKEAPGSKKLRANVTALPLRANSFDLVVGEAMIHQGGPMSIGRVVSEIKRVLKPHGTFLHVSDVTPDPTDWAHPISAAIAGYTGGQPVVRAIRPSEGGAMVQLNRQAHANVFGMLQAAYRVHDMNNALLSVQEDALVPERVAKKETIHGIKAKKYNDWTFHMGALHYSNSSEVPPGKVRVTYGGAISLGSKEPKVRDIIKHLEKRGFTPKAEGEGR